MGHASNLAGDPLQPLRGVRVLDLTVIYAGPSATMLLGDWGAEVIRLESFEHYQEMTRGPLSPEPGFIAAMRGMRHPMYAYPDWDPGDRPWNRYAPFNTHARNKLSVELDVSSPSGRQVFLNLVAQSDVVVENNAPTLLEKLDLNFEVLRDVNPEIILTRMPAFGLSGPYRSYKANGANIDAATGHLWTRGYPESDHGEQGTVVVADAVAGLGAALATVVALLHRRKTGRGQLVEVAMTDALLACLPEAVIQASLNHENLERRGNGSTEMIPHGCYPCRGDDHWITIGVESNEQWLALCKAIEFEDGLESPAWRLVEFRRQHSKEIDSLLEVWTRRHPPHLAMSILQSHGVSAVAVLDEPMAFSDPHLSARQSFVGLSQLDSGNHLYQAPWWLVNGARPPLRLPPCALGEHTELLSSFIEGASRDAQS